MIKKSICIKNFQDRTISGSTWGTVTGLTDNGDIIHYTGQTNDTSISYDNYLGKGNRLGFIDYSQFGDAFIHYAHLGQFFLDGSYGIPYYEYLIGPTDNSWFKFDFKYPRIIQEITLWQDIGGTHGLWKWQGSNDNSIWVNIGNEFLFGVTDETIDPITQRRKQVITELSGNTTAYRYYKCSSLPGGYGNSGPYLVEMEFKIDNNLNNTGTLLEIPILLTQTIDNIGFYTPEIVIWSQNTTYYSGETIIYDNSSFICTSGHTSGLIFNENYWIKTPIGNNETNIVQFTGETKINEFRRYGKTDSDSDLYNPTWNTGFTQEIYQSNGLVKQITGERQNSVGSITQNLYDYKIWVSGNTGTTINYSDISPKYSVTTFNSSGMTNNNSIDVPKIKLDYLIGVIEEPKINIDVFIDRGSNSSFERHMKLGDVKSFDDLENYGNGYYKIKED